MDRLWGKYKVINKLDRIKNRKSYQIEKYSGRDIISIEDCNRFITECIEKEIPAMICRFGETEMRTMISYLNQAHWHIRDRRKRSMTDLCNSAGFFPYDIEKGKKFVSLMLKECSEIDLCGIWNLYMEDYILEKYAKDAKLTILRNLEPWRVEPGSVRPWSGALAGKRVLVIHPFEKTIIHQYEENREKIFCNVYPSDDILPKFELKTIKAVQSIENNLGGEPYEDWFDALASMISKCKVMEFDVAIIGCGAYGFPLAAEIKKMGKVAIHLGGSTQLLFGIMGKRWEAPANREVIGKFTNEFWTRPSKEETPKDLSKIEYWSYW